jgi:hypothetical protein
MTESSSEHKAQPVIDPRFLQEFTSWRRTMPVYLAFVILFPLGLLLVQAMPEDPPTVCLFRLVTHLECPTCGMTRAFRAMSRLDVREATGYNPLGPPLFAGAVLFWGYALGKLRTRGRLQPPAWWRHWQSRLLWVAVAAVLVVGVTRMVHQWRHPLPPPRAPGLLPQAPFLPLFGGNDRR